VKRFRHIGDLLKATADAWVADDVPRLSASLAFYTVLSLIPILIDITAVASRALGQQAAQGQLMWEIQNLIGQAGARAIQTLMQSAHESAIAATVFGSITLAFSASAVVLELRDALNTIWNVSTVAPCSTVEKFLRLVKERFYLFGLILGGGLLMLASLALNAFVEAASARFGLFVPVSATLARWAIFIVSFCVVTLLFAAVYKFVPDVRLAWKDVIVGAGFTSLLFTIGRQLIGIYLAKVNLSSTYGAAGSILIVLLWVYYSAQLFFLGAEFTKIYGKGTHRQPSTAAAADARPVVSDRK
jgi:membrane protein